MYLPGTIGDLIGDLRKNMDLNQKELAEKAGISESKLSRIESSETKNINSLLEVMQCTLNTCRLRLAAP